MGIIVIIKKVIILNDEIINMGEWDYGIAIEKVPMNPWPGPSEPPEDWDFNYEDIEIVTNPLPEGSVEKELEVIISDKGRYLLATDWYNLREDAYPPIKDQLDAAWKGGEEAEAMKQLILSIKEKYPKPIEE